MPKVISIYPNGVWIKAICDQPGCKLEGVYFQGGKFENHYCYKHNLRLKK